ncbi:MAG: BREX system ATP-binding domain-containing protein [Nitratireductor sp.]|uniref:BREX system ATP-binding domain-containing protein n=1 Tax=Parvibaculum sp. TaxID=2024848 RepID=UPI00327256A2
MSLRDRLRQQPKADQNTILTRFGVLSNPFPTSSQTSGNPHYPIPEDSEAENRILSFIRDENSEVLVVLGTQGVGKTNFLNYLESEIADAMVELDDFYIVRYMADPEPSFDGIIRTILQELGTDHLKNVAKELNSNNAPLDKLKSFDLRQALFKLMKAPDDEEILRRAMEWLLGFRLLNVHRDTLGVSFRLDTVESRTAVLREYILLSSELRLLKGIFLLLDELEKQAGVLGPTAVVRYLSSMRAIIDALPKHLFLVIALTPDALRRYSSALPAFRSRLENQITLRPLLDYDEAQKLARFYLDEAKKAAARAEEVELGNDELVTEQEMADAFANAKRASERRGDEGVRQREFLNSLHSIAEQKIQALNA